MLLLMLAGLIVCSMAGVPAPGTEGSARALAGTAHGPGSPEHRPQTWVRTRPDAGSSSRARFRFGSNARSASFECRLDRRRWRRCRSPASYRRLRSDRHTFTVRARARGLRDATPAVVRWRVEPRSALAIRLSGWEPRLANAEANRHVPTAAELERYRENAPDWGRCNSYHDRVDGQFSGTTDEIIQWAAAKWDIDVDLFRAVAVVESNWRQSTVGDRGESFGLMQVRPRYHRGTWPLARDSTAFNADYYGAIVQHYRAGCASWLNTVHRGRRYFAGDLWGSIGAWYSGRWHTSEARGYVERVRKRLADRPWTSPRF